MEPSNDERLRQIFAACFPLFQLGFLQQMHDELENLVARNGGNAEMTIRFKDGEPVWENWTWNVRKLRRPDK